MRFRKLRIAWSLMCFIALVLLLPDADTSHPSQWFMPILIGFLLLAVGPWIPPRFSLRTLLIASTIIAVLLGLIVYATRQ
jgi:hypothetical protein